MIHTGAGSFIIHPLLLLIVIFLFGVNVNAESVPSPVKVCVACHGKEGLTTNSDWPNLAGQNIEYLASQMRAFQSGERKNLLMAPVLASLSDKNILLLADFYSKQVASIAANGDGSLIAAGENASAYCVSCHGMKGKTANSEWPNLAGQNANYIEIQLRAFRDGIRINTNMNTIVAGYSDETIKSLAAYYSQLKP